MRRRIGNDGIAGRIIVVRHVAQCTNGQASVNRPRTIVLCTEQRQRHTYSAQQLAIHFYNAIGARLCHTMSNAATQ